MSLPLWERGLKYQKSGISKIECFVAPLVGAWIEMLLSMPGRLAVDVAPLVGAWIEICETLVI